MTEQACTHARTLAHTHTHTHTHTHNRDLIFCPPGEDAVRKQHLQGRVSALTRHQIDQHLDLGLASLPNDEKISFYCLSNILYGILLW